MAQIMLVHFPPRVCRFPTREFLSRKRSNGVRGAGSDVYRQEVRVVPGSLGDDSLARSDRLGREPDHRLTLRRVAGHTFVDVTRGR
jgi:hypothetical protein